MKQFMSSREQTSDLVGGHVQTLLWHTAKFVEKSTGSCNVTYLKI